MIGNHEKDYNTRITRLFLTKAKSVNNNLDLKARTIALIDIVDDFSQRASGNFDMSF